MKAAVLIIAVTILGGLEADYLQAQQPYRPQRPSYASKGEIEVLPVQGSVYLLAGGGSNITVQVGPDAVFVVDANEAAMSDKVLAAIRTISRAPIRYIVNTSADLDHVGGNERLAKAGGGANINAFFGQGARVYAQERAYSRMANPKDGSAPLPSALWPTDSFIGPKRTMFVTGEPIEIIHQPAAHTDGDVIVFFRKSDVISTGDVFVTNGYPVIDTKHGGTLQGVLDALNRIIDTTIPEFNELGGTRVIPGHGRICNEIDVVEYRDMLTIIRDRITLMAAEGKTIQQVKAARVTLDYDGVYGATTGPWTTDMFIETVYREISARAPKNRITQSTPSRQQLATTAAKRQSSDPFDGNWTLNTFKSLYVPSTMMPYRREMTLDFNGDDVTHSVSTWRRGLGNNSPLARVEYTARLDGKEYPVEGAKVTLKRIGAETIERVATGDKGAKETATWKLSSDRKMLTIAASGVDANGTPYNNTQVYDRQP